MTGGNHFRHHPAAVALHQGERDHAAHAVGSDDTRARDGGMTTDDLRAIADRILLKVVRDHPDVASEIAALLLSEILGTCLFGGGDEAEVDEFVLAVNSKLAEISLHYGADRAWQLVSCDPPRRH